MTSVQYNDKGEPTGGFYGGTFIKIMRYEPLRETFYF